MQYTALYRQWRPDTFDEVVGQDHVVRTLKNQIKFGRISHAYLFCGSRGTGKTSTAKIFARAINCEETTDGSPCGTCNVCQKLASGNNMDVIEIDAASNNGVDEIRDLRDKVKYPPSVGRYKVYIIDEVHMLSTGAFNALLKTLEEPPDHVVFILATTEPHRLPATILSRCQRYDFKRIPLSTIVDRLGSIMEKMDIQIEHAALETIARWAEGGMRDALSLLDQCIAFCGESITNNDVLSILGTANYEFIFSITENIIAGNVSELLFQVDRLVEDGRDIQVFLRDVISHLRNLLLVKVCKEPDRLLDVTESTMEGYKAQAGKAGEPRLIRAIDILSSLESELKWSTQPRVLLEMALIKVCRPVQEDSFEALLDRIKVLEDKVARGIQPNVKVDPVVGGREDGVFDRPAVDGRGTALAQKVKVASEKPAHNAAVEKTIPEKPVAKATDQMEKDANDKATPEKDIKDVWPDILKEIKRERVAIYSLLGEVKIHTAAKGVVTLVFPDHQGFYAAAVDKEANRKYIEGLIAKYTGREVRIVCRMENEMDEEEEKEAPSQDQTSGDDIVVEKAIELFGEEFVEVVEEE